ncbi:MAG: carboxypeptidase-like regulatory domain-containing protein [Bacteroidales bacterium]|jgi:hypothetical protein|nr:carboxypeptidase-like regulatory domain-containing protein [Bacteroidales bacterium]
MNSLIKKIILCVLFSGLFFSGMTTTAQENYFTISGVIKDEITKKPIEYATISVTGYNIGTISNEDGDFSLKIPAFISKKTFIECSHIGYYSIRITTDGNDASDLKIFLTPYTAPINEVIVQGWDAQYLIQEAIRKIGDNYSSSPTRLTGFYRETIQKKHNYINITEAIIDIYKTAYTMGVDRDLVQIMKGRKILSPRKSDTLAINLMGGPNLSVALDVVKDPDFILSKDASFFFSFELEGTTQLNGRDQFIISFEPKVTLPDHLLYTGTFYIDKENLAFSRADIDLDMSDKNKVTSILLKKKPIGLRFKPSKVSYIITYREQDGKTYLHYIRNNFQFKCDWKRKLFSTNYSIVSEMVVTNIDEQNVSVIPKKSAFHTNQILTDEIMNFYDQNFWGAYNIIEPTESLDLAISRLKKRKENTQSTK